MVDVVRYPGGKNGSGVYQAIINQMPEHSVYIEPFLGSGAVMRLKRPAQLNIGLDLESGAIGNFGDRISSALASGDDLVASPERAIFCGAKISADIFGSGDAAGPQLASSELASGSSHANIGDAREFRIVQADAMAFLKSYRFTGAELVYCDPPYVHSTRGRKRLYKFEMSDAQHIQLLKTLARLPCSVILSGYHSDLYMRHLTGWRNVTFQTVNRAGQKVTEWLWMNYPEPVALHDYRYLGGTFRERERIKRKTARWSAKLAKMPLLERRALQAALVGQ